MQFVEDGDDHLLGRIIGGQALLEAPGKAPDDHDWIPHLMGHPSGEFPQGRQTLGLQQLVFHHLQLFPGQGELFFHPVVKLGIFQGGADHVPQHGENFQVFFRKALGLFLVNHLHHPHEPVPGFQGDTEDGAGVKT